MAMKEWFQQLQPMQLYVILTLTLMFFFTELVMSYITHSLTLLMDSYHMLCNIVALSGCIITIKYDKKIAPENKTSSGTGSASEAESETSEKHAVSECQDSKKVSAPADTQKETKLKNTFGWARIDVIVLLICFVFLSAFSFSIVTEALQNLVHIDHQDAIHHPIPILCIGATGLLLNSICYLLIGGYTFHQGSFLHITESGDVVLDGVVTNDSVRRGDRRLSRTRNVTPLEYRQRQGIREMCRDVVGCVFVIICATIVYLTEQEFAKFVDPILSMVSAVVLIIISYPYMKESCLILLQTIPGKINIDSVHAQLLQHFPDIVNVHDFHIWQLTATKVISTVHIIFLNPQVYAKITNEIKEFFLENGITQVTVQPEFFTRAVSIESINSDKSLELCLMQCQSEGCKTSHCCPILERQSLTIVTSSRWKSVSKEALPDETTVSLKSVTVLKHELAATSNEYHKSAIEEAKGDENGVELGEQEDIGIRVQTKAAVIEEINLKQIS